MPNRNEIQKTQINKIFRYTSYNLKTYSDSFLWEADPRYNSGSYEKVNATTCVGKIGNIPSGTILRVGLWGERISSTDQQILDITIFTQEKRLAYLLKNGGVQVISKNTDLVFLEEFSTHYEDMILRLPQTPLPTYLQSTTP